MKRPGEGIVALIYTDDGTVFHMLYGDHRPNDIVKIAEHKFKEDSPPEERLVLWGRIIERVPFEQAESLIHHDYDGRRRVARGNWYQVLMD